VRRYIRVLLSFLAGPFFSPPVSSCLRADNFQARSRISRLRHCGLISLRHTHVGNDVLSRKTPIRPAAAGPIYRYFLVHLLAAMLALSIFGAGPAHAQIVGTGVVSPTPPPSPNSPWTANVGTLFIGAFPPGTGTLTTNGGTVLVGGLSSGVPPGGGRVSLGPEKGMGTLNIGAAPGSAPSAPGTLTAVAVLFGGINVGGGTSILNFNHNATDANPYVFSTTLLTDKTFTPALEEVNILAGTTILNANNAPFPPPAIPGFDPGPLMATITIGSINGGTLAVGVLDPAKTTSFALGFGDVVVQQGGTLRTTSLFGTVPGAFTGKPLAIYTRGNYTQEPGGTLLLGIGGFQPPHGQDQPAISDQLEIGGRNVIASLNGTLVVSSLNGFHPSATAPNNAFLVVYTDYPGSKVTGNFSLLNDSAFNTTPGVITGNLELRPIEIVSKNEVWLVYVKAPPTEEIEQPPTGPPPPEQPPPGEAERPPIVEDPGVILPPVLTEEEITRLIDPTAEQLTSLYEVGFSAANMQRFNLGDRMFQIQQGMTGFVSPITPVPPPPPTGKEITEGKGAEGKAPPPAPQPGPTNRWGVWANGWGDFVHLDSTSAALGYNFTTGGMSAGVDYLITDHFAVGLFGGYSHTWVNFNPSGSATVNTGRGGLYATYFQQGWWVDTAVWGGGSNYSTSRQGILGMANGSSSGWELSTFGDAGYDFHCGDLAFGPTVSMQYTKVHLDGFGETGSLVPLNIHGDSQDSLRTDVGGQAYYRWRVGSIPVIPNLRLAWEHEYFYSNLPITASAPALNGATATFNGPNEGHDSLIINANIAVQWTPRIWTTIGYDGQVARDHYNSNAVTGTFSFSF